MAPADDGLEVTELGPNSSFEARPLRPRSLKHEMLGMRRLAKVFVERPEAILQELAALAVDLCGADSAGISMERPDEDETRFWQWVAVAGQYNGFLNAALPRYPSACGVTLERGRTQHLRVGSRFFELIGVDAPVVTDGLLLPWQTEQQRGTIFILAHGRREAFDSHDLHMMTLFADFAAMALEHQLYVAAGLKKARAAAAAAMANELAHEINNPLQSLTNLLFLMTEQQEREDLKKMGRQALTDLDRLSTLVGRLLALPYGATKGSA